MSNAANPASASNPTVVPTASGAHAGARPGTVPPPSRYVDRSSATPKPKAARTTGQPNSSQRPGGTASGRPGTRRRAPRAVGRTTSTRPRPSRRPRARRATGTPSSQWLPRRASRTPRVARSRTRPAMRPPSDPVVAVPAPARERRGSRPPARSGQAPTRGTVGAVGHAEDDEGRDTEGGDGGHRGATGPHADILRPAWHRRHACAHA
jgi:hypothetical protein